MTLVDISLERYVVASGITGRDKEGRKIISPAQVNQIRRKLVDRIIWIDTYVFGNTDCLHEEKYYMQQASLQELADLILRWQKFYGKKIKVTEMHYSNDEREYAGVSTI